MRGSFLLAVWTGLEPATPCVTGMYSNQLNYQTNIQYFLRVIIKSQQLIKKSSPALGKLFIGLTTKPLVLSHLTTQLFLAPLMLNI